MRRFAGWLLLTLALAAAVHLVAVSLAPRAIMAAVFLVMKRNGRELNTAYHEPRPSAERSFVVMPSPDLLYSVCAFDVSETPLRITAAVPDTYWSISMYAFNTDNFFVLNDQQAGAKEIELVLTGPGRNQPAPGARVAVSPTARGVVLFRTLIPSENRLDELIRIQKLASCKPLF